MERVDLVIVGAGWHGLAMARTYLAANLSVKPKIIIMDYAESIGGTWAKERLYPGLKTNNAVGTYEFSDFPMDLNHYGLKTGQHIPGEVVHQYLSDFAKHYSLTSLIRWRTKVDTATILDDETWHIGYSVLPSADGQQPGATDGQIVTSKLVIATGLTSEPYMPHIPGQERFQGNIFHSKQLKSKAEDLTTSRHVVVIGGNKSSLDVCYNAASSGAQVHMVVRTSGGGPCWIWRPIQIGPFRTSLSKLSLTRFFTWFDPSPFGNVWKSIRSLIHRTVLGQMICWIFWASLDYYLQKTNGYDDDRLKMVQPWTSTFWMGNSLSVHNYGTDWFELVKEGKIVVHNAEIVSLTETMAHLSDGKDIAADTVVCCTGWKTVPTIRFGPPELASGIGLPTNGDQNERGISDDQLLGNRVHESQFQMVKNTKDSELDDAILLATVQEKIKNQIPALRKRPLRNAPTSVHQREQAVNIHNHDGINHIPRKTSPYRLYRFVVPPREEFLRMHNLAFIGMHMSIHIAMLAQAQALWITAFFQQKLPTPDFDMVRYETYFHTEYESIRRPKESGGAGERYPDLVFDSLPYIDLLLEDLGLQTARKRSWWKNIILPYTLEDYRGLIQEWLDQNEEKKEK